MPRTPPPGASAAVCGLANVQGKLLPGVDLTRRVDPPSARLTPWQSGLWLKTSRREQLRVVLGPLCRCTIDEAPPGARPERSLVAGAPRR